MCVTVLIEVSIWNSLVEDVTDQATYPLCEEFDAQALGDVKKIQQKEEFKSEAGNKNFLADLVPTQMLVGIVIKFVS